MERIILDHHAFCGNQRYRKKLYPGEQRTIVILLYHRKSAINYYIKNYIQWHIDAFISADRLYNLRPSFRESPAGYSFFYV